MGGSARSPPWQKVLVPKGLVKEGLMQFWKVLSFFKIVKFKGAVI